MNIYFNIYVKILDRLTDREWAVNNGCLRPGEAKHLVSSSGPESRCLCMQFQSEGWDWSPRSQNGEVTKGWWWLQQQQQQQQQQQRQRQQQQQQGDRFTHWTESRAANAAGLLLPLTPSQLRSQWKVPSTLGKGPRQVILPGRILTDSSRSHQIKNQD